LLDALWADAMTLPSASEPDIGGGLGATATANAEQHQDGCSIASA
jgi:hypothetical protein